MSELGYITITDTETGEVEVSEVLSLEEGMKMMENEIALNMTIICNIQKMEEIIRMSRPHTYDELENVTRDELEKRQDELIPMYNAKVKEGK